MPYHVHIEKSDKYAKIEVESLRVITSYNLSRGTIDNPGQNVKAKSGLNRSILQQSWGKFFEMLEYKLKRNGGKLIKVNPKYSSQTCPECGYISKENRKTQARFKCIKCEYCGKADYVASVNLLKLGAGTVLKAS